MSKTKPGFWEKLCKGGLIGKFARNKRASVAVNFALCMIPLLAATGTAVDLARTLMVRQRLLHALDSAGLAVGKSPGMSEAQVKALAQDFFNANYPADALGSPGPLTVVDHGDYVTLEVSASLNTSLLRIIGIDTLNVNVSNKIARSTRGLEIALVLDTTGSMAWDSPSRISSLKEAANALIDILFGSSTFPELLKMGIVPFSVAVKVNPADAIANNWIDTDGTNAIWTDGYGVKRNNATANFSGGKTAYWLYTNSNGLSNTPWTGCVEQRPDRLDETDTAPSDAVLGTKWVPMFWPDEPDESGFTNKYISTDLQFTNVNSSNERLTAVDHGFKTGDGPFRIDSTGSVPKGLKSNTDYYAIVDDKDTIRLATSQSDAFSNKDVDIKNSGSGTIYLTTSPKDKGTTILEIMQKNWVKYKGKSYSNENGPYRGCGMEEMLMLTNDKAKLKAKINSLSPSGNTHVPVGLGWGWRIISPKLPGSGAVSYDNDKYVKAIVLMTDGENTMSSESNDLNKTQYTAYGFGAQERLGKGINTSSEVQNEIDESLKRTCANIKAIKDADGKDRIRLYTIAFGTDISTTAKNILCNCASDADVDAQEGTNCPKKRYFYAPSGNELKTTFQVIATDLSSLRIAE